ncbi:outer membrane protein transport protein [Sphingomonas sanguinis]|uniref:OmpP1/FadL family transporter n=1 Tax=Sphingomonas sp. LC-1 TaxID=3110957 RepID=UPI0021BB91B3|nr:outer membrane protein transport protein [Sphingomonas sp. LC-1]MCT8000776.1 outer membrane protein transport protein [Sphingomonas sp. LC-1]
MTKGLKASLLSTAILSSSFAFAGAAHGQAFYLQEQSTRGQGRAFSGEGADTGASSLWWNPAAIAGMERGEAVIGASAIIPKGDVVDTGTVILRPGQPARPVGGNGVSSDPINRGIVPSGAVAYPLNDRVAVGLAVTSPYSFTTEYDANSWARYSALKTELRTIDIQPSVGIALLDWLRVGGALNVEYTKAELGNALPNLSPLLADGYQRLKGDGWDLGWTAGVQLHNDWATVGISYKSRIKHQLKGSLEVGGLLGPLAAQNRTVDGATAEFYTPAQIIVAGRFRATDKLTLNAQAVRFTWADFDAIRLGAPINTAIPENYKNSFSLAGGFDYAANDRLTVRAGVQRGITPTQNGNRDARVPDANRWNYSIGGSYKLTPRFTLDAAGSYIDFANASIDRRTAAYAGTAVQTPILTSGQVQNARAFVASIGGRFSF